nr:FtsW/RodA/SpoVE family cell cycle protein [Solirubrobacteraceae bacterium]
MSAPPKQIPFDFKSDWSQRSDWRRADWKSERNPGAAPSAPARGHGADGVVLVAAAVLVVCGVVMIFSATSAMADGATLPPLFLRHVVGVALGLALGIGAYRMPLALWRRAASGLWIASVALLAVTDVFGVQVNGARRWLQIPGLGQFQPAEVAKLATLLAVASVLARREGQSAFSLRSLALPAALAAVPAALLLLQPDMGNAVVLLALVGALVFVAGAPLRLFVAPVLAGAAGLAAY